MPAVSPGDKARLCPLNLALSLVPPAFRVMKRPWSIRVNLLTRLTLVLYMELLAHGTGSMHRVA
jgi:hypothetical protein